ncbi:hypothetical protein IFM89_018176 [Coptis chinensis]|uniref:BTB domain-containing protein n=1 Tax=Coptis chinensis TaxID=261450 RepID=A0A835LVH1_9MAGN|nr:hypothetical protein IFM89_018176 [Coptis chinensis]
MSTSSSSSSNRAIYETVVVKMKCISCREEYGARDAGTCKECYEEASETEEELKQEIEELKAKVSFLKFSSPIDHRSSSCFTDVLLVASDGVVNEIGSPSVSAHKAILHCLMVSSQSRTVLVSITIVIILNDSVCPMVSLTAYSGPQASRSPVFKAMLENEMEESRSGTIKISEVTYDALRSFVQYLYTAEVSLDEQMACDLLVLAEKYQVKHLKSHCETFLTSKLNAENAFMCFAFSSQHNAKNLHEASLSLITENMDKLTKQEEYQELVDKDPRLVVGIYEAYLVKQFRGLPIIRDSRIPPTEERMDSSWSELPSELLNLITDRLMLPDLIRFGCVCKSWESLSSPIRHKGCIPWLIPSYLEEEQELANDQVVASSGHSVVMCIHVLGESDEILVFCRPSRSDSIWRVVEKSRSNRTFDDVICFNGKFYAVDCYDNSHCSLVLVEGLDINWLFSIHNTNNISGQFSINNNLFIRIFRKVYRWVKVNDLGENALFLSNEHSFSVCVSKIPGCKKNCIYFNTDWSAIDSGIYNLEDETIEALYQDDSLLDAFMCGKFYAVDHRGNVLVVEGLDDGNTRREKV